MAKGVLIFSKNTNERLFLGGLLKAEKYSISETSYALEALKILQKEDIGVIVATKGFKGMEEAEFKALVEKMRPGVSTIFIEPFSEKNKEFSIDAKEFLALVHEYLKAEFTLPQENKELKQFFFSLIDRLLQVFEVNDRYFFNNDHHVARLSHKIALKMGLEENLADAIEMAALLRDLGKVGIHNQILEYSMRLGPNELTPIKHHPVHTLQILKDVKFPWDLNLIISQHHEHYDGSGYPKGLKGEGIAVGARIIAVADAFYAMVTDRPYRKALPKGKAVDEILRNAGNQFDPKVVDVFISVIKEEPSEICCKKKILIFEKKQNVAALIKLGINIDNIDIIHVSRGTDAVEHIRLAPPDLIITDVEALNPADLVRFFSGIEQKFIHRFLLVMPEQGYPENLPAGVSYITQPINMKELKSKIENLLEISARIPSQKEHTGLKGSVSEFNLSDVIQILSIGRRTARIEISKGDERGLIYLRYGEIVHASVGKLKGNEAFYELINWDTGAFHIIHNQLTNDANVTVDTTHLLLDAVTMMDNEKSKK